MEDNTVEFELPVEKVTVKYIKRRKGMAANVDDNHVISGGMLSNSKRKFSAPLSRSGGIVNILKKEEKIFLEKVTGLDLSVYGDFWKNFQVTLHKDSANNTFNMDDPLGYISIRLLETLKDDIAPNWDVRKKKQTYQFVITRENEEFNEKKAKLDTKKQAFKSYGKIEDDKDKLIGVLKLLTNKPISKDSKLTWLQGQVEDYVDKMPSLFMDIINDPSFDTKVLLNKAVEAGVVIRNGNKYSSADGLELARNKELPTFDNAIRYLDDPKNQEVRTLIEARINNTND